MTKKKLLLIAIGAIIGLWAFLGFLELYIFSNSDWEWEDDDE